MYVQSDLIYPNTLVPTKTCSDCNACGLLNHCKIHRRGYQEVCSDCEAYGLQKHGLTRSDCIYTNMNPSSGSPGMLLHIRSPRDQIHDRIIRRLV